MRQKNKRTTPLNMFLFLGCLIVNTMAFGAAEKETEQTEEAKAKRALIAKNNVKAANENGTPPFSVDESAGRFRNDFDRLTDLMRTSKTPLNDYTPDWLNVAIEHRTRYQLYDNGFTKNIPGFNDTVSQRTRFLFEVSKIIDPLRFTLELTDFRAPMASYGQDHNPGIANHFDFTQLHLGLHSTDFLGTGYAAKFEVGRFILDFGEARLVGGHRWGPLTPAFDGIQFVIGNDKEKWGMRIFGTRPVNRQPTHLDWNTPESYFSGIHVTNRDIPWANVDAYFLQLNEGNSLRKRNLSTTGFRVFAKPVKGKLDYEVESMYQFGDTNDESLFAHRHHGEIGYSFNTEKPFRLVYLFDYSSGDRDPNKNFDILYAKRRVEYGPTGMFGPWFPSNLFSPAGFRATFIPTPTVRLMLSHRAYWLADKHGAYVGSGLQDTTGNAGSFLGNMLDVSVGWDPQIGFLKRVSFDVGYSHIFKGSFFDKISGGNNPDLTADTNYGYMMTTFKF